MTTHNGQWDAIIIGSGMGGLTTATLLARLHAKRVLVLERHTQPGGLTHVFSRGGGFCWDVGVHYVAAVTDVDRRPYAVVPRDIVDVVTGGELRWQQLPAEFEQLVFPDFKFTIRAGKDSFRSDLKAAFPHEAAAIDRYLADVELAASYLDILGMRGVAPAFLVKVLNSVRAQRRRLALTTTGDYLSRHIRDPRLKAVLGARWGDFGVPPAHSAFLMHALIARHYFEGAAYPVGSSKRIAETACQVLRQNRGEVRLRTEAARILVKRGKAVGVELANGESLFADTIISNAGARNTYLNLLPADVDLPFRAELRASRGGMTTATLYVGLKGSPESIGVRGENYWFHDELDHDSMFRRRTGVTTGEVALCYLSFPSLKDPTAHAHTAEIVTAVDADSFRRWSNTAWLHRGSDYEGLKERIGDALLETVEQHLPGFRSLVVHRELSTPLTVEHFTQRYDGEIYGPDATPERFQKDYFQVRTPIPGLLLTGSDGLIPGVVGAARAGLLCTASVAGPATFRKLRREAEQLRQSRNRDHTTAGHSLAVER